jgi:hypothetical protein
MEIGHACVRGRQAWKTDPLGRHAHCQCRVDAISRDLSSPFRPMIREVFLLLDWLDTVLSSRSGPHETPRHC